MVTAVVFSAMDTAAVSPPPLEVIVGAISPYNRIGAGLIDNFLHRGGGEDGVALIGAEGEAGGDDGVLPRSAGNLKGGAEVAYRKGRAQSVGAGDRSPPTVVWERSSVAPAVVSLAFCPAPAKN